MRVRRHPFVPVNLKTDLPPRPSSPTIGVRLAVRKKKSSPPINDLATPLVKGYISINRSQRKMSSYPRTRRAFISYPIVLDLCHFYRCKKIYHISHGTQKSLLQDNRLPREKKFDWIKEILAYEIFICRPWNNLFNSMIFFIWMTAMSMPKG